MIWTPEMDSQLRELRLANTSIAACAEALGVSRDTARRHSTRLGLPNASLRFRWNDELDNKLRDCRARGMSYDECAAAFGMDIIVIGRRCRELGINRPLSRGQIPGRKAVKENVQ